MTASIGNSIREIQAEKIQSERWLILRRMIDPMRTGAVFPRRALFGLALAMGWLSVLAPGDDGPQRWVTTWTTANAASDRPAAFSNQTIREVVHTTIGGITVRIRL